MFSSYGYYIIFFFRHFILKRCLNEIIYYQKHYMDTRNTRYYTHYFILFKYLLFLRKFNFLKIINVFYSLLFIIIKLLKLLSSFTRITLL